MSVHINLLIVMWLFTINQALPYESQARSEPIRRNACDPDTGHCSEGCKKGMHGPHCNRSCDAMCFNQTCNQADGHCSHAKCEPNFCWDTGRECHPCFVSNPTDCKRCYKCSQICSTCISGWYGRNCSQLCGKCSNGVCDQLTGHCNSGCSDGWRGPKCSIPCSPRCVKCADNNICVQCLSGFVEPQCNKISSNSKQSGKEQTNTIVGAAVCGTVVVIIITGIVVIKKRCKQQGANMFETEVDDFIS